LFSSLDFFSFVVEATGSSFLIISDLIFSSFVIDTVVDFLGNSIVIIDSVVSSIKIKRNMNLFSFLIKIHNCALACTDFGLTCIRKAKSLAAMAVVNKSGLYHIENSDRERGIRRKEKRYENSCLNE